MEMRHQIAATMVLLAVGAMALPAGAAEPTAGGVQVVASEPGKAAVTEAIVVTATVTAVDKATRLVSLKGPEGKFIHVEAGEEVRNFDQIKVGDMVAVRYVQALELELRKGSGLRQHSEKESAGRAKPGEKPAAAAGRQVTVVADVVGVDPEKKIISLKGPKGRIVDLKVNNPDHFKVVRKGDQVEAVYTEALALSVEPAKK
jgi:hypothetical protein